MSERDDSAFLLEAAGAIESKRAAAYKACRVYLIAAVASLLVSILFFMLGLLNMGNRDFPYAAMNFTGLAFFVFFLASLGTFGVRETRFKSSSLHYLESEAERRYFKDLKKNANGGMPLDEFNRTRFYAPPDRYLYRNYRSATYEGIRFCQSAYELQARQVRSDGRHTYVEYLTYAQGTIYRFDFERKFPHEVRVVEGAKSIGGKAKKVETEYIAFNRKFGTFSDDSQTVFYLLTPQIQEKILSMEQTFKGNFALGFIGGNHLYVSVNDSGTSIPISIRKPFTKDMAAHCLEILTFPIRVIEEFGLASAKFKKNAGVEYKAPSPAPKAEEEDTKLEKILDEGVDEIDKMV